VSLNWDKAGAFDKLVESCIESIFSSNVHSENVCLPRLQFATDLRSKFEQALLPVDCGQAGPVIFREFCLLENLVHFLFEFDDGADKRQSVSEVFTSR
jgi:hypothetical protein